MIDKYNFELALEKVAEKFYFNGAVQYGRVRGGNSKENEAYFRNVATDLRGLLSCQQILLTKGACPDSGVFGDFYYKNEDEVSWNLVQENLIFVIEVNGVQGQKRYIEVDIAKLPSVEGSLKKDSGFELCLNELGDYGEFFGVEYKATDNKSPNSISVASFNSTCPSGTKTATLKKVKIIHNLASRSNISKGGIQLKHSEITLSIKFSIYYLIVNDEPVGNLSQIRQIFICSGDFFAPGVSEDEAKALSTQLYPENLGIKYNLYRVGLRYRPFFDSKMIRANGYGLYTSWVPKIPAEEEVERQRELLLKEVERVQQNFASDDFMEVESSSQDNPDNVIYLNLRDERIKKRAA